MKTVVSEERGTGTGATRYTAVLLDGSWWRVSMHPTTRYLGKSQGFHIYELAVADDAITARFYRSNSGNESVFADNGMEWGSFAEARRWAAGWTAPKTCPHCGRSM